jgi:hypothetical protein
MSDLNALCSEDGGIWYPGVSDEQIELWIMRMTSLQKLKFIEAQSKGAHRRQALLIARSYPMNLEESE